MPMVRCMTCMEEYDENRGKCPYCGSPLITTPQEVFHLLPGSTLQDRYLIGSALGSGSLGITYIAWDNVLVNKVAIKEYLPVEFTTRMPGESEITIYNENCEAPFQNGLQHFMKEAERLANFRENTGIVRIFDTFEENGTAYIVMEYLEGETLENRLLREKKIKVEEAMSLVILIAETMKKVHAKGIIHRNISPNNIFLTNLHEVKIMDFGAARNAAYGVTQSLSVIVKTGYAPEEQYRSKGNQGTWTDVYSLAATFYRMITGVLPENAIERSDCDTLKPPSAYGIVISDSVESAIMKALNLDISDRTLTMDAFLKELKDEKIGRKRVAGYRKSADRKKRIKYIGFSVGGLSICLMLFLFLGEWFRRIPVKSGEEGLNYKQVPDLTGMSYDEAEECLQVLGVDIEKDGYSYSNSLQDGTIVSQNVNSGIKVENDMTIRVVVTKKGSVPKNATEIKKDETEYKVTESKNTEESTENTVYRETTTAKSTQATTQRTSEKKKTTKKEEKKTEKKTTEKPKNEKTTEEQTEVIVIED